MAALVMAGLLLAAIAVFEARVTGCSITRSRTPGQPRTSCSHLGRSGVLRAMGSTGHSIALGYVMAISLDALSPHPGTCAPKRIPAVLLLQAAGLSRRCRADPGWGLLAASSFTLPWVKSR